MCKFYVDNTGKYWLKHPVWAAILEPESPAVTSRLMADGVIQQEG